MFILVTLCNGLEISDPVTVCCHMRLKLVDMLRIELSLNGKTI